MNRVSPLRLAATLLGAACWGTVLAAGTMPAGEGRLDIVTWAGYIERGSTDPRFDWVTPFEQATGCKVTARVATTSDEMIELMRRGGVDLVTASGDASLRLVYTRLVQPLDLARVPGFGKHVDPRLRQAPWHYVNGRHFGVPFMWGPNVLVYDTRVFRTPPADWRAFFEPTTLPDGRPNAGRVQARDNPIRIADAALYLMGRRPELGIRDPYELDETQYTATLVAMRAQQALLHSAWRDEGVQIQDFRRGRIVLANSWTYPALAMKRAGQPIDYTVPKSGTTGWADTTMLHAQAAHPLCAYQWLEWSIQPQVQGDVAAFTGAVPTVPAACAASPLLGADGCRDNGAAYFDRIRFWKAPTTRCVTHGRCVGYARWQQDYAAIVSGRPPP